MKPNGTLGSLEQFDLLPDSFRVQHRTRRVFASWTTIVCALSAVLCVASLATILRSYRVYRVNQQIAAAANPLQSLRKEVLYLQTKNRLRSEQCEAVEAARPDDSLLQALAAIAVASQSGNGEVLIDSLQMRMPIEFPPSESSPPDWAIPYLTIQARSASADATMHWVDRLNRFDRIEGAVANDSAVGKADLNLTGGDRASVRLMATPLSTRVLP